MLSLGFKNQYKVKAKHRIFKLDGLFKLTDSVLYMFRLLLPYLQVWNTCKINLWIYGLDLKCHAIIYLSSASQTSWKQLSQHLTRKGNSKERLWTFILLLIKSTPRFTKLYLLKSKWYQPKLRNGPFEYLFKLISLYWWAIFPMLIIM